MRVLVGALILASHTVGCTRSRASLAPSPDAGRRSAPAARDVPGAADVEGAMRTDAVFSAPIAAVHVRGSTVVAGLVVGSRAVRAVGFAEQGHPSWSVDAIGDVAWAPDAALTLQRAGDGVALAWRGGKGQHRTGTLVFLGANGELRGPPQSIGADWCSTTAGPAWVLPGAHGRTRVESRAWREASAREVFHAADDRSVSLVCGERTVYVVTEGDDDLMAASFVPGVDPAGAPTTVLGDKDFGDDEAEHRTFTVGDDLELLRISEQGSASVRTLSAAGAVGRWRRWKHSFAEDDDIAVADGDESATIVVFTRASASRCAGAGGAPESAQALRIDAATGEESVLELAAAECARSLGPFWIEEGPGRGARVGWLERAEQTVGAPPVIAIGYRAMRPDDDRAGRLEIRADAVENGGCASDGCFAVALMRENAQQDAMQTSPLAVVRYP